MSQETPPRVTLVTSNGWGLGHLSREIAIALAIGDRADVTMFSFSRGLPLAERFGIRGEFCPGRHTSWIPFERWNSYVEDRFRTFIAEIRPNVVLFDGVAPYIGILNALLDHPSISAGWLRRGMWLRGPTDLQLTKASSFDFVVEPGDLAAEADRGPTSTLDVMRVPPVSLIDMIPSLDRDVAADELGLDASKRTLLFAMGSGQPGDAADVRNAALTRALEEHDWQVGLIRSPLATGIPDQVPGTILLEGVYPLTRYLAAFDAAVSAAGYNSVHELIPAGIPTLLVPKSASQTDNQVARAAWLAANGMALMAPDDDSGSVRSQLGHLLGAGGEKVRASLRTRGTGDPLGGADEVAALLTSSPPRGVRETGGDEWRQPGIKGFVKRAIGPRGVALVQRALGRAPKRQPRTAVSFDAKAGGVPRLELSSDSEAISRTADNALEHILPGSSSHYEQTRRALIDHYYDVI